MTAIAFDGVFERTGEVMERYQLKRVIIIILAIFNGFLGLYLVRQRVAEQTAAYRAEQELLALFAADGVTLSPDMIPRGNPPPVIQLTLNEETQQHFAAFFLGVETERVERGNVQQYGDGEAVVRFHADGSFTATGLSLRGDPKTLCREFCRNWSYAMPDFIEDDEEIALTARYGGFEVFNCGVALSFEGDTLREAFGTMLPRNGTPGETPELDALGALAIFQAKRRENRAVSAEIRHVSLCYALQSANGEDMTLVPAWRVETDTAPYYVNCDTGGLIFF